MGHRRVSNNNSNLNHNNTHCVITNLWPISKFLSSSIIKNVQTYDFWNPNRYNKLQTDLNLAGQNQNSLKPRVVHQNLTSNLFEHEHFQIA